MSFDEKFDVIVIGGGHAGCEAASASARMGAQTALVTMNLDLIGQMSCNPAIGGIAKGHLVREIDALGGIMGRIIDRAGIQFRLLNRSRGPAVQSPRAQADRSLYRTEMRLALEATPNLHLRQGMVIDLIVKDNKIQGVELQDLRRLRSNAVVIATGTFLNGLIHTGKRTYTAGRAGEPASIELAQSLKRLGFKVGRLKTGTPPRLDGRTVDWDCFEPQPPDETPIPFSFATDHIEQDQISCYIGYTNTAVHQSIRNNLHESPLYSGKIKGIGPRYCPSIEDKVVKFADKNSHQLFLEPEGYHTNEVYLNGFSTSLPSGLQQELVRMIPGLHNACIIRPGYAIEYDFVDPRELNPHLETIKIKGLFHAGQINGTTGYEEAGCQGLIAGINASLSVLGRDGFRLRREEAYIGVLVDDLISQGVDEPYRIFTSRAEFRLALRHDNADERLENYGRFLGLIGDSDWEKFNRKRDRIARLKSVLETTRIKPSDAQFYSISFAFGATPSSSVTLSQLALRPNISSRQIFDLLPHNIKFETISSELDTALSDLLYSGYIDSLRNNLHRVHHSDSLKIPSDFCFRTVNGLSHEMIERFERTRPRTFGEARCIPGLTPASISALLVSLNGR
ncbi:MAG TPA: tRNA uridine-5-carboxymethylaminomethyl(34) synthesis enzyme MnmG [Pyrinomonadaceae bacterium]|nr:tRNA uridine-5-carboxymethylaminomethyl(34) synthesis enzyme MnmG [Pyrinomonadaceae bacterium]